MSNHPWNTNRRVFSCPPGCQDRKPGCQDHCERYAKDKAAFDERKKVAQERSDVDHYICDKIVNNRNRQVIHDKHKRTFKTPGHKGR